MTTRFILHLRAFPVRLHDHHTGAEREDVVVLDKSQLQAAQLVGQSSKELIHRICGRQGCSVLDIGRANKQSITLNLEGLSKAHTIHRLGKRGRAEE